MSTNAIAISTKVNNRTIRRKVKEGSIDQITLATASPTNIHRKGFNERSSNHASPARQRINSAPKDNNPSHSMRLSLLPAIGA